MSEVGDSNRTDHGVEELLRINGELAAEIRSLRAGKTEAPRSATMPAARRLAGLIGERDRWQEEAEQLRGQLQQVEAHNRELGRHIHELTQEHARMAARRNPLSRTMTGITRLGRQVGARLGRGRGGPGG